MPKLFISYRRADSKHAAGRIGDRLMEAFGRDNVLKDVDTLPLGRDFREELKKLIPQSDVLLAIIGEKWLTAADAEGKRRLDNEADWVRVEIETALHCNIPVVPLLIGNARMPKAEELPESLAPLAYRHGTRIGADPLFRQDVDRLIHALQKTLRQAAIDATLVPSATGAAGASGAPQPLALDVLVADVIANFAPPAPSNVKTKGLPSDWAALRKALLVVGLLFAGLFVIAFVVGVIWEEQAAEARRKKLIQDFNKSLPNLMPPPPVLPDMKGLFPADFPSPTLEELLKKSQEGNPAPEPSAPPGPVEGEQEASAP